MKDAADPRGGKDEQGAGCKVETGAEVTNNNLVSEVRPDGADCDSWGAAVHTSLGAVLPPQCRMWLFKIQTTDLFL